MKTFLLRRLLSILLSMACTATLFRQAVAADAPRLSEEQVTKIAMDYVREKKLLSGSQSIKYVSFDPSIKVWVVLFGSDSQGEGHFGLTISDTDAKDIDLQKGL